MKRRLIVLMAASLLTVSVASVQAAPEDYGIESFGVSLSSGQAGAHADFVTTFELKRDPPKTGAPFAPTERIEFTLPPGLSGNPAAFPKCTARQLVMSAALLHLEEDACPQDSQVGVTQVTIYDLLGSLLGNFTEPVYNMAAPGGDVVARLGFVAKFFPTFVDIKLDPENGYGLTAVTSGLPSQAIVTSSATTLWGDPTNSSHDPFRITPYEATVCNGEPCTAPGNQPRHSGLLPTPFMTSPTRCGAVGVARMSAASYELSNSPATLSAPVLPILSGCSLLDFSPEMSLRPTTRAADSPSGIDVSLALPQQGLEDPKARSEAHLKRVVVTLPEGMTLNPSAAAGLGACSEAQIGLVSESPIRFNAADAKCPDSSKVGTAEIETPVLPEPLKGSLYIARPDDNPFNTLLSGYLVATGQGALLKVPGRFDADPATGRLTATFNDNPEQPFDELRLHFKDGAHGVLVSPPACGNYGIESRLSSWSAKDPENPTATETVSQTSPFGIDSGPNGRPCPSGQFDPDLEVGVTNPIAGTHSPFVLRLAREDGTQRLSSVSLSPPPGWTGTLAGLAQCSDAAIVAAEARTGLNQGAAELLGSSCPAGSRIGSVTAGAGAGPSPFFVDTGEVYLAGPYRGAPLSVAIITPAVTGPFDLGTVVVRVALRIDPKTARITAVSDPLPAILHGIPLALRDVRMSLDRPDFILNPTNCEPMNFIGQATSESGAVAPLSERFQVGGCRGLGFKPELSLRLFGGTHRGAYQRLRATLTGRKGDANIARVAVTLPDSAFLAQEHIKTVCTRVQFALETCPPGSVYGRARAVTPLLDEPFEGPVYLRSSDNLLPDLVMALKGPAPKPIKVEVSGRTDAVDGALRNTFDVVPDVPVTKFTLELFGGERGLIVNSKNLCRGSHRATVRLGAQSGKRLSLKPPVKNSCGKRSRKGQHRTEN